MTIDATFWVMISFFAFIGLLIYFKIPQKIINKKTTFIKTGILSAIAACWGVILVGTFITFKSAIS